MSIETTRALLLGMALVSTLCGCRAMSNTDMPASGAPSPPPTAAPKPTSTPEATSATPPTTTTNPSNNKEISNLALLREALGQGLLPLIDGGLLTLQKAPSADINDPNLVIEEGKLELTQTLHGKEGGQGSIHAHGSYQKLGTLSGGGAIYAHPTTIDFNFEALEIDSTCYGTLFISGNVRCTLDATHVYGSHTLSGTGQCMTHTNGILDNLRITVGSTTHKVRYVSGVTVHGNPHDFGAYSWVGTAYVDGQPVNVTHLNENLLTCD